MALVDYSSSDSDDSSCLAATTNSTRFPLPAAIRNFEIYKDATPIDDPNKHNGRIRTFKHERGNWATYLYIPVNIESISNLQICFKHILNDINDLYEAENIHISLTKTLVVQHHWIPLLIKSFQDKINIRKSIHFTEIGVYCNEERTRTFIGLTANSSVNYELLQLLKIMDNVVNEFRLPTFYSNPSFHASILWCVGDHEDTIKSYLPKMKEGFDVIRNQNPLDFEISVNKIFCKTGNKLFSFEI